MPDTRALRAAIAEPWAITAEGLELVLQVAARENTITPEALEAYRAEHVPQTERLKKRGNVAVLDVTGPLFRRANLFTAISGATSYDILRRDLQAAIDDPGVSAIVMTYDTPGGEITGVDELAKAIRAGKARKPIVAYVGGTAASAGYWLASQSSEIVVAKTAILGSIGVRAALQDTSKKDAEAGRIEFISSQSPGKRTDLTTDEGRARIQRTIDALADVFIASVAEGRGVKPETVISNFGGGDVLVGQAAINAGMADRIGDFEAVISELAGTRPSRQPKQRMSAMSDETITRAEHETAVANARNEGAAAERARVKAILDLPEASGRLASAKHLAFNTAMSVDDAKAVLAGLEAPKAEAEAPKIENRADETASGLVLDTPKASEKPSADASKDMWARITGKVNAGFNG